MIRSVYNRLSCYTTIILGYQCLISLSESRGASQPPTMVVVIATVWATHSNSIATTLQGHAVLYTLSILWRLAPLLGDCHCATRIKLYSSSLGFESPMDINPVSRKSLSRPSSSALCTNTDSEYLVSTLYSIASPNHPSQVSCICSQPPSPPPGCQSRSCLVLPSRLPISSSLCMAHRSPSSLAMLPSLSQLEPRLVMALLLHHSAASSPRRY